jgi:hypothetical protein
LFAALRGDDDLVRVILSAVGAVGCFGGTVRRTGFGLRHRRRGSHQREKRNTRAQPRRKSLRHITLLMGRLIGADFPLGNQIASN